MTSRAASQPRHAHPCAAKVATTERSLSPWADAFSAAALMTTVWLVVMSGHYLRPYVGAEVAVFVTSSASMLLVWLTRPRKDPVVRLIATPLGALIGFQSLAFWLYVLWHLGSALGLEATGYWLAPGAGPLMTVSLVVLAPVFEELLYRERLLLSLRRVLGTPLSILISSACFALPHVNSWGVLNTLLVGFFLSVLMLWSRSIALCIGIHVGLNLAAILCGIPPTRWYINCQLSGVLMVVLSLIAGAWERKARLAEGGA